VEENRKNGSDNKAVRCFFVFVVIINDYAVNARKIGAYNRSTGILPAVRSSVKGTDARTPHVKSS